MKMIDLDATNWKKPVDLHDAVCAAIGAPMWHTRSIDALLDSTIWHDDINASKPPYSIRIHGLGTVPPHVRSEAEALQQALIEAREEYRGMYGSDVAVELRIID